MPLSWRLRLKSVKSDPAAGGRLPLKWCMKANENLFKVDHPEQFPIATAEARRGRAGVERYRRGEHRRFPERSGDFAGLRPRDRNSRQTGRPSVKGQVLMRVQSADISRRFGLPARGSQ